MALGALLISFLERSSQILDLNNIPKEIEYYQQNTEIYFDNVYNDAKFGWGTGEGLKIESLPYSETIKVFNTKSK